MPGGPGGAGRVGSHCHERPGCGVTVRNTATCSAPRPQYAAKAERISALTRDSVRTAARRAPELAATAAQGRGGLPPAYHPLHAAARQSCAGGVESHLNQLGFAAAPRRNLNTHPVLQLAGTYSGAEPRTVHQLRERKLGVLNEALRRSRQTWSFIQHRLHHPPQSGTGTPVRHWVEVLDETLRQR